MRFAEGQWILQADSGALRLRIEADDEDTLRRLQNGIVGRIEKIGRRDQLTVTWQQVGAPAQLAGEAVGTASASEPAAGKASALHPPGSCLPTA